MHAFEDLVGRLVRREGFWVRHSVKIELTKQDKVDLGQPSLPRPELDLVAYKPSTNVLALIECKSYLDSQGVSLAAFDGSNETFARRFRLFTQPAFRTLVTRRLHEQLVDDGFVPDDVTFEYWLVAGRIAPQSHAALTALFQQEPGWRLFGRDWIRDQLLSMRHDAYEDDVVVMAMKLTK